MSELKGGKKAAMGLIKKFRITYDKRSLMLEILDRFEGWKLEKAEYPLIIVAMEEIIEIRLKSSGTPETKVSRRKRITKPAKI